MQESLQHHLPVSLVKEVQSFLLPQKPWLIKHQAFCGNWEVCFQQSSNSDYRKLVFGAAQGGCVDLVSKLIREGADASDAMDGAAKSGSWNNFQAVVKLCNKKDWVSPSLFYYAARGGNHKIWSWCAARAQDILSYITDALQDVANEDDEELLRVKHRLNPVLGALRNGHYRLARRIQAWCEHECVFSCTMLERFGAVCRGGQTKMIRRMISEQKIPLPPSSHVTPFVMDARMANHYSEHKGNKEWLLIAALCRNGKLGNVKHMLNHFGTHRLQGDERSYYLHMFLVEACKSGDVQLMHHLCQLFLNPKQIGQNCFVFSLISPIVCSHQLKSLQWLHETCDVSTEDTQDMLLGECCRHGWVEGFQFCLSQYGEKGVFKNDAYQKYFMTTAISRGDDNMVRYLLPMSKDITPTELFSNALQSGHVKLMKFAMSLGDIGCWNMGDFVNVVTRNDSRTIDFLLTLTQFPLEYFCDSLKAICLKMLQLVKGHWCLKYLSSTRLKLMRLICTCHHTNACLLNGFTECAECISIHADVASRKA